MDQPEASMPTPAGPVDQAARAQAEAEKTHADAAEEIRNAFMREGRLSELAEIVLDLGPFQNAEKVPTHVLQQATAVFIKRYTRAMRKLLATGAATE